MPNIWKWLWEENQKQNKLVNRNCIRSKFPGDIASLVLAQLHNVRHWQNKHNVSYKNTEAFVNGDTLKVDVPQC